MNKQYTYILIILIALAAGAAYYFYDRAERLESDPQAVARDEALALLTEVGKLIVLPEGEEPTIGTVRSLDGLADQPFFANAKVGDRVIMYPNSGKAYLYDPVNKKIVEVAPINLGSIIAETGGAIE